MRVHVCSPSFSSLYLECPICTAGVPCQYARYRKNWFGFDSPQIIQGATVGQRLSRLTTLVLSRYHRMDHPIDREDCYSATHPSDHNSIHINSRLAKQRREVRRLRWKRRRDRDGEKNKRSKGKAKNKDFEERYARGQDHDPAFMVPVPLIYGYGYPWVYQSCPGLCAGVSPC